MKLVVFFIIVVANISNNGKASIDNFSPSAVNLLFEDNTKNFGTSCYRPCKFNVKPRQCRFRFNVEPTFTADGRPAITINGKTPGPPINVCQNDIIIVDVRNRIPDQDLSIHWNGIEQKGTPHMDGVPMITQCPIPYGSTYKYAFIASAPGTFFYHADSASHQSDGVYGALVVNQPQTFEPHFSFYDYDRSLEHTYIVAATFPQLMTGNVEEVNTIKPNALVIREEENFKMPGFSYRVRLINAIAIECPLTMSIDRHEMMVIASDGRPVQPVPAERVQLYPGLLTSIDNEH
ncbi:hypothetical protein O0L34_g7302 [Tuta absoluta]|nr:hypothetical protein O0L34_g7302 [Tuta absoluta]